MKIRIGGTGVRAWGIWLLCAAAGTASDGGHPAEVQALVDQARSVAPEFASQALLRLAQSSQVADRGWKVELLEEAFRLGGMAQERRKRVTVDRRDSSAAFRGKAYAQNLDADSLQCLAVQALLPLDRKKARDHFAEIPPPQLAPLTCADSLVYDVSLYYETLTEVAHTAFSPKEIAQDEPFQLVQRAMSGISSPGELGPAARMLAALTLKPEQHAALLMSFSGVLKQMTGDPRSFAAAIDRESRLGARILSLAEAARQQQTGTFPLIEAYRSFLVRHLSGTRCSEQSQPAVSFGFMANQPPQQDAVLEFNEKLRGDVYPAGAAVKAIAPDEIQPAKVETSKPAPPACAGGDCGQLLSRYRALIFSPANIPFRAEEKETSEWRGKLKEYLGALADWKDDGGDPSAYFRQKCSMYSDLFNLVPKGPDRDELMQAFVAFLNRNGYQREHRLEWFLPVNTLIGRVFADPYGLAQAMKELRQAEDPAIALFANLEQALPRSPAAFVPLL